MYRLVLKPWHDGELLSVVRDAASRYEVVRSLRHAGEAKLLSLAQTIELKDAYTRGHCDRVAEFALVLAGALGLDAETKRGIKHGSWLHDCGKIGVPEASSTRAGNWPMRSLP